MAALNLVSLENFYRIPWDRFWDAARNTAILTVTVPTVLVVIGVMISWVVIRSGSKYAGLIDTAAFMPHAVPNLIFSVAILVVALFWLPEFVPFYNTIYILIASFIVAMTSDPKQAAWFRKLKASATPDIGHGIPYKDTPWHKFEIHHYRFRKYMARLLRKFGASATLPFAGKDGGLAHADGKAQLKLAS
jgi:hypothetical protein